jgi:hypothetical protein
MPTNNIGEYFLKCDIRRIKFINGTDGRTDGLGYYAIGKDMNEDEQVKTMIHELLHNLPKYKNGNRMINTYFNHDSELHAELKKETEEIYHNRPIIRNLVLEKLNLARKIQKMEVYT